MDWQAHIVTDPAICGGRPHVRGTRLTVELLLDLLAAGWTGQTLLEEYPHLTPEALRAVFAFAHDAIRDEHFSPGPTAIA